MDTEAKINEIGAKIDVIESIVRALISSICSTEELTQKDASNFVFLLEDKLKELKTSHDELIDDLHI